MSKKVALIGASGKIGTKIAAELLSRGHTVTGIARHPDKIPALAGLTPETGDITAPAELAQVLKGHDAIIGATSFVPGETDKLFEAVRLSGVNRFLMIGGAASLLNESGERVVDSLELPVEWMVPIREGIRAFDVLKQVDDFDWTFFSPAVMIGPGERTGNFRLGKDQVVKDAKGDSKISYDDYAIAMVDELEQGNNLKGRFTIGY
jgi:putative NADH-flavin reductase